MFKQRACNSTCAAELLALDLADAFVGEAARVAAPSSAGLDWIVKQVVGQPLQMAVTHEGILSEVSVEGEHNNNSKRLIRVKGGCAIKQ